MTVGRIDQYIDLTDFTAGIVERFVTTPGPDGTAQLQDTWGCYGDPAGGLHPLPKLQTRYQETWANFTAEGQSFPAGEEFVGILDAAVVSPVRHYEADDAGPTIGADPILIHLTSPTATHPLETHPDGVAVAYVWHRENATVMSRFARARFYKLFKDSDAPPTFDIYAPDPQPSHINIDTRVVDAVYEPTVNIMEPRSFGMGNFAITRTRGNLRNRMQAGTPVLLFGYHSGFGTMSALIQNSFLKPEGTVGPITYYRQSDINSAGFFIDSGVLRLTNFVTRYPDVGNPAAREWNDNLGRLIEEARMVIVHQGRMLCVKQYGIGLSSWGGMENFGDDAQLGSPEAFSYSQTNDVFDMVKYPEELQAEDFFDWVDDPENRFPRGAWGFAAETVFLEENPSGYGVVAPQNANELLLIKKHGGGGVIRGEFTRPTVINLPQIEPTGGLMNIGVGTPLGYLYGARSGIWVWRGGQESECVSMQLDGHFWDADPDIVPDDHRQGISGRFGYKFPFAYIPNGYLLDTRAGGWWRLRGPDEDVHPYMFYNATPDGRMFAHPSLIDSEHLVYADIYDTEAKTSTYSWRSQPLTRSINRILEVAEVVLVAEGTTGSTVTVTIEGIEALSATPAAGDPYVQTEIFTLTDTGTRPQKFAKRTHMHGSFVQVRIQAEAPDANTAAPVVHSLQLGVKERMGVAEQGSA